MADKNKSPYKKPSIELELQGSLQDCDGVCEARRQVIQLASSLMLALPALPALLWVESRDVYGIESKNNALDTFMDLSTFLTARDDLNYEMGARILQKIMREPWGKEHLQRVLQKSPIKEGRTLNKSIMERLDAGELWFVGHLLTTWVTGSYFHESGNNVISYEHALMHTAFRDVYPEPYICSSDFAYWQAPPVLQ